MAVVRLDHVSYAAGPDGLAAAVQRIGSMLGAGLDDGGLHPRFGTRNFTLPLAGGTYLEVVGALDHPATDKEPFGQAVKRRGAEGGGWMGWVVAVDDINDVEQRLGRPAVPGNRHRPDGHELHWRQIGVRDLMADPALPFFVQWLGDSSDHPSAGASPSIGIERLEICGDPAALSRWLGEPASHPLERVAVDWVSAEGPGLVAVHFATAHGSVRID